MAARAHRRRLIELAHRARHGVTGERALLVWLAAARALGIGLVREETGTRETLLGHWAQAGVRSGEVVKQMGVFVDGRVAEAALSFNSARGAREWFVRFRACLVPPKRRFLVTLNLRYMHEVLNVDKIKN